ncbi:metal-dependent hydrolase [Clostridium puniceum]|uniref:Metal-dependent hydrolase n=1 Tax=Clostridium puniceum TaxID=29367 RepID=A0A1S8TVC3_9CLOT|nr:MBL fold metallo-hydrolase [Clostridium puniceum]OOM81680.1 metal-dependent hydrolase [Clostridium puniceum]
MQIIWYGYSSFLIKTSIGKRILIDPFDNPNGCKNNFPQCDLVTTSSSYYNNLYLNSHNPTAKVINEAGTFYMDSLEIEGLNSFQDKYNGFKRGPNIIYIFKDNKYSVCHLGNLGHIPSSSVLEKLRNIDILLIPIGGNFTLNGLDATKLCNLICPKYIIPMHYKTNSTSLYLDNPKNFITSMKHIRKINSNILNISDLTFIYESECIILTPPYT